MFCKSIIESDAFLDMPAEAQMLYIHLNLACDDDGFCDNPRSVMRQCGASNDSMKILIAKKFVLTFEKKDNFIVVIKHWRMNNYIRKDNYRETKYKEFMRELYYDENKSYSTNPDDGHKPCLVEAIPAPKTERTHSVDAPYTIRTQSVDESLTQDRIVKDSKEKDSIVQDSKGECEGENAGLIDRCGKLVMSQRRLGYYEESAYRFAENMGISRETLDAYLEEAGA